MRIIDAKDHDRGGLASSGVKPLRLSDRVNVSSMDARSGFVVEVAGGL
jgi:hypothetical protein